MSRLWRRIGTLALIAIPTMVSLLPVQAAGTPLYSPVVNAAPARDDNEEAFSSIRLSTLHPQQGQTVKVSVTLAKPGTMYGLFRDQPLHFSQDEDGVWWALLAIGMPLAQARVGLPTPGGDYPLYLAATNEAGETSMVERTVRVIEGQYTPTPFDPGPEKRWLLDLNLRTDEATRLQEMFKQGAADKMWQGRFMAPIGVRVTGGFNVARTYPDGSLGYHEGLDYGAVYGSPIRAAAHGIVTLAEPLTVRGNVVYIDHGMGVFSGYFHMSQILVEPGQEVEPGDIIGRVGSTGLSTGPHVHFEIRLNGYNVSPAQWLQTEYP